MSTSGRERDPAAAELDAPADQHPRARGAGALDQLVHEPRLSDPGLASHEHRHLLAGQDALERTRQGLQLRLASHQDGAYQTRRHRRMMANRAHGSSVR